MAEKLDKYTFRMGGTSGSRYDQWLDGDIYRLHGDDITTPKSARCLLYRRAKGLGLKVRTTLEDGAIVVQAYKPEDD